MVDSTLAKRPDDDAGERHSVLGELPNTRPQRTSRRREAARASTGTAVGKSGATKSSRPKSASQAAKPATEKQTKATRGARAKIVGATTRPSKPKAGTTKQATSTPRQGYEADSELTGTPVNPPTGTEMVGALADLAGELAHTGISAGGRLLKEALSRLSG